MKRTVFIISRCGGLKDHLAVRKTLSARNIKSSIVNIDDSQHEKLVKKCGKDILLLEEDHSSTFYDLKKTLFRNNIDFFTFGRLSPETISLSSGNLDIGFNKDTSKKICTDHKIPEFTEKSNDIVIDIPPESIPYRYLGYFRSPYLLVRNLISFLSSTDQKRHGKVKIIAPVRPYDEKIRNSRILETLNCLGKRGTLNSGLTNVKKGSIVLTWSTDRSLLLFSMGFKPVPLTRCLAASALFSGKNDFKEMLSYNPDQLFPELFHTLESIKLENSIGFIYKTLER